LPDVKFSSLNLAFVKALTVPVPDTMGYYLYNQALADISERMQQT
jgi:uncharacterized protein (DUF2164 family)